jgi:8-oxo-dGTP pyrophosphatase MutT (NUDIX family)
MISFVTGTDKFQVRAAFIIMHNNKVLFQRVHNEELWFVPGGRVDFFESSERTIERELLEEFGVSLDNKRLVWVVENFVEFPESRVHEIGMFYLVDISDQAILSYTGEFVGIEDWLVNQWIPIDELEKYKIVPEFVIPELNTLDPSKGIKHVISKSVR